MFVRSMFVVVVVVGWRKNVGSTRRSCIFNKVKKRNWR